MNGGLHLPSGYARLPLAEERFPVVLVTPLLDVLVSESPTDGIACNGGTNPTSVSRHTPYAIKSGFFRPV